MPNPLATVVVPSFNSGHFLALTLASIANQTLKNFECIVVDDCSTDGSIESCKQFFRDPRFRLIRHKMNVGLSGARNTGLRAAKGEFVAFLDSDDLMMANSLEVRVATCRWGVRTSDRFAGSYCGSEQIEESVTDAPPTKSQELGFVNLVSANGLCPFNANQPMIRRDILRLSGGFNQALKQAEDFDLWQRILRAGYVFAPAKFCSVTYRKRQGSMIRRGPLQHLAVSTAIIDSAEKPQLDDQVSWSKYRMPKPLNVYAAQARKISRVMEFVGMDIGSERPSSIDHLASLIMSEIPDYRAIIQPSQSIAHMIFNGVRRQTGTLSQHSEAAVHQLVDEINYRSEQSRAIHPAKTSAWSSDEGVFRDATKDRPWFESLQSQYSIIFIPHSAYHVWTISLLEPSLRERGINFITVDISPEWRDGGVRKSAEQHGIELIGLSEFILGHYNPQAIAVFNDWDPITRPIIVAAKNAGIKTFAIVEGIQDYDDADVHWDRFAYKTADVILLPGEFDRKYFNSFPGTVAVVGVPRIETLRSNPASETTFHDGIRVLINSNFSYGVLEEHRDSWLEDCVQVVLDLGMIPVISRHPADKGALFPQFVSPNSFYDEIETAAVSVQRFASGILEALARNVGVVYYNPHGEKVDKFQSDPMDAFALSTDRSSLKSYLARWKDLRKMAALNGGKFLDHHAGSLAERTVDRVASALQDHMGDRKDVQALNLFLENLAIIDVATLAFSQARHNGVALFPDPSTASAKLDSLRASRDKATGIRKGRETSNDYLVQPNSTNGSNSSIGSGRPSISVMQDQEQFLVESLSKALLSPSESADVFEMLENRAKIDKGFQALLQSDRPSAQHFRKVAAHFGRGRPERSVVGLAHDIR